MKRQFILLLSLVVFLATAFTANAQITTPSPSPTSEVTQTVGLTKVTINYSRPGVKERTIFADDGLVPYGKLWRFGANSATKITFSDDVKVAGNEVKAGSYAVLATPTATDWSFSMYTYEGGNWSSYVEKEAAVTFTTPSSKMPEGVHVESFLLDINNLKSNSATIDMVWEKTYVAIPLEVYVDERVEKQIKQVLAGPTGGDYYAAASYYHEKGENLEQALKWVQMATGVDSPMFWQVRREALILADLGRYPEAVKIATKSMELAMKAGNDDYVAMNKKSIAEWTKK
jgi:hypothetical protein